MTSSISRAFFTAVVAAALSAGGRAETLTPPITLGVPGLVNATPSLAVSGGTVVAVWTAAKDGSVNVYLATSTDGGITFSEPRRVNEQSGDAGANNEQPPRVTISGTGASRVLTVVWSKRNEGPQRSRRDVIRMARSTDGGRTFSQARTTHAPAFRAHEDGKR